MTTPDELDRASMESALAEWRAGRAMRPDWSGADLQSADLRSADLRWANLQWANLQGVDLRAANLQGANLPGVDLRAANLQGVDLQGVDLRAANLQWANLQGVDLRSANLQGVDLQGANLQGVNLRSAIAPNGSRVVSERPFQSFGPLGREGRYLQIWHTEVGIYCVTGCFAGSDVALMDQVLKVHGATSVHGMEYRMAVSAARWHMRLWATPTPEGET